jgi:hypothetical protein
LIALTRRGFLYLALPITPCALTFPSLETSCKPLRRREVVPPIDIENATELQSAILDVVDPLAASNEMGIDIYEEVLTFLRNMTNAS